LLGQVVGVDAGTAQPTSVAGVDPPALADGLGAAPMAVADASLVGDHTDQAVGVASLDEAPAVSATDGDAGDDLHRQEMAPTLLDHRDHGEFTDPPAGIPGLAQQTTLEPTVVTRTKPSGDSLAAAAFALLDLLGPGLLHVSIVTRPCLGVKV